MKQWIDRFKGVATKYLDNYIACFLFVDSRRNESTNHNIKEFLLSSFVFEMTDTYVSLHTSNLTPIIETFGKTHRQIRKGVIF